MPILCNYYLTYRCNASCSFCRFAQHERFAEVAPARTHDVIRNLIALKQLGVRFVDFTGGEPLLHPDLGIILTEAKRLDLRTSITTNGILYPRRAETIRGLVDLLHFSLEAGDAATHDAIRGAACFEKVLESVTMARRLGEFPDILCTVMEQNIKELSRVYQISRDAGLVLLINPVFSDGVEWSLTEASLSMLEEFAKRPLAYLNPSLISLRRIGGNDPAQPLCKAVSRVIVISPENEILLPCYHFHSEKIPIGGNLLGAYRNPKVEEHRRQEGTHSFCRGCAINCYFEPSFAFPTNIYALASVPSKLRYGFTKYVRQPVFRFLSRSREV